MAHPMAQRSLSQACTWPDHSTHTCLAGAGGYARAEHDALKAESAHTAADGDYECAAALQQQAASSHYQTVTLEGKRIGGEDSAVNSNHCASSGPLALWLNPSASPLMLNASASSAYSDQPLAMAHPMACRLDVST